MTSRNESGFTLVELLMVSFLVSLLSVAVLKVITQIQSATQTAEEKRLLMEQNFRAFTIIRSHIMAPGTSPLPALQNQQGSISQPFPGRSFSMNRSIEVIENQQSGSMLRFISRGAGKANPLNRLLYGDIEIRIFVDASSPDRSLIMEYWNPVQALPGAQQQGELLQPLDRMILLTDVEQFSMRNFVFNVWQQSWDNPYAPKPVLIEMTFIRTPKDGSRDVFRSVIPLG